VSDGQINLTLHDDNVHCDDDDDDDLKNNIQFY